jgi:RNA polymerase sigma factor (sigma-70 family)
MTLQRVGVMERQHGFGGDLSDEDVAELTALLRRVVGSRVRDRDSVDDIVQETLARVFAARNRLDRGALGPYAVVTARNLVTGQWRRSDTSRRNEHRLIDLRVPNRPDDSVVEDEEATAIRTALGRLAPREREVLVEHVVNERDTSSLADEFASTPGAVAAQLNRSRAKLRVEYLLALGGDPPARRCRPVLLSLSAGDRRRQAELDAGYHLLDCDFCASMSGPLIDQRSSTTDEVCTVIEVDSDVVLARQRGHELATSLGFSASEATVIATAISELARNIVRFARRGEIVVSALDEDGRCGVMVVAQDAGPGIPDLALALTEGHTTYGGYGLGLPGCRRMMDEFDITSEVGRGTIVTMTKWHRA